MDTEIIQPWLSARELSSDVVVFPARTVDDLVKHNWLVRYNKENMFYSRTPLVTATIGTQTNGLNWRRAFLEGIP